MFAISVSLFLDSEVSKKRILDNDGKTFGFFLKGGTAGTRPIQSYYYLGSAMLSAIEKILLSRLFQSDISKKAQRCAQLSVVVRQELF